MSTQLQKFDSWLIDEGPAALVLREHLIPVEGKDGVIFPATFAASEDKVFKGGYNINEFQDGRNICLVDSVGSQANRLEPIFSRAEYAGLVPQVTVTAGTHSISLLEAGHRAADAIVRCSSLRDELLQAFQAVQRGDAIPLAKIAPTSLVFGAWDSRETQAKLPRLLNSTIRAYDVKTLTRSAQYVPAAAYDDPELLGEPGSKAEADAYAKRGFAHVPAPWAAGGVIAEGGIRRDATLHLAALRLLRAVDAAETFSLQRYILGLAMTAFTYNASGYLRQGCNLVRDPDQPVELQAVFPDGLRENLHITHADVLAYTREAAAAFGVGEDRTAAFDKAQADSEVRGEKSEKVSAKARKSAK